MMRVSEQATRFLVDGTLCVTVDRTPVPGTERKIVYTWVVREEFGYGAEVGRGTCKLFPAAVKAAKDCIVEAQGRRAGWLK